MSCGMPPGDAQFPCLAAMTNLSSQIRKLGDPAGHNIVVDCYAAHLTDDVA
jgi:hypothetical protein